MIDVPILLVANGLAFVGLSVAILAAAHNHTINLEDEEGRSWGAGLVAVWMISVVGLMRRFESSYADTASFIAWTAWAFIAWARAWAWLHRDKRSYR